MRDTDFFQHVHQFDMHWCGRNLKMPPFYYDVRSIEADFVASADEVRSLLPSERMHPLRLSPGHCAVVIAALQYRDTDIGPYNEVLIGIPFTLDVPSPMFTGTIRHLPEVPLVYVHHLPVTTEIARGTGTEFLSAPKFLAEITFEDTGDWIRCSLAREGVPILRLSMRRGELLPARRSRTSLVTVKHHHLLRWEAVTSEHRRSTSHDDNAAELELGSHVFADELRNIGLGKPRLASFTPRCQMTLSPVLESFRR
jgi:hypothetical protein